MTRNTLKTLHLTLFIYGDNYFDLCTTTVLPNLVALIGELPADMRAIMDAKELAPILMRGIADSSDNSLSSIDLTRFMFDHWQKINEHFIWNGPRSIFWKSYASWRVGDRQLLMKCWQGPALFLWPYREIKDYDGCIDHRLIKACVHSQCEVYIIADARELHKFDLTPRDRVTGLSRDTHKRWFLFKQLLVRKRHCRDNILYGRQSICVYDEPDIESVWREAERKFNFNTKPAMYTAIVVRPALALLDGAWRHSGIAGAESRLRVKISVLRTPVKTGLLKSIGRYGPRAMANRIRARIKIRMRVRHIGAAALTVGRATSLLPRTRLNAIWHKLHDLLQPPHLRQLILADGK